MLKATSEYSKGLSVWYVELPYEEREPLIKEARKYFTDAAKYIDVMTPDGKTTIGLKATHELNRLDNIPNLKVGGIAPEIRRQ